MKPLIIAHRGASREAPENTMKAFRLASEHGADGLELDVFLSADGSLVVTHDDNLRRLTGHNLETKKLTFAQLRELDFGQGEKIPLLSEVFEAFGEKFKVINVEIKSTGFLTNGVEKKLVELIRKFRLEEKIYVSSFNPLHIIRTKRLAPELKTGYLISPALKHWLARRMVFIRNSGASTINLDYHWADETRLSGYQTLGKEIWVWTVDDPDEMKKWIARGVAAIITNYPERLKKIL
ncbi:MAG: glycerophosphodiester phosphodiesterase family protein [Deltaproteobacteria bacterium]|nr:glycerophosphodiester phosphodiesterase family protein [Deltaproteobacteria bacterium]